MAVHAARYVARSSIIPILMSTRSFAGYGCQGERFEQAANHFVLQVINNKEKYSVREPYFCALFCEKLFKINHDNKEEINRITTDMLQVFDADILDWAASQTTISKEDEEDFMDIPWNQAQFNLMQKGKYFLERGGGVLHIPACMKSPCRRLDAALSEADVALATVNTKQILAKKQVEKVRNEERAFDQFC